ncbi:MAG TPA: lipopolysaccharide transport periplasmic protein LptA [Roseiarcus sp.]|jgi:lipopolysaccharide export system protein LptA
MTFLDSRLARAAALAVTLGAACAAAAAPRPEAKADAKSNASSSSTPLLPGTNSKEPISIEADKLVYFDKEQKAIYTGNVVVIQGDTKMTCSGMTIFMEKAPEQGQPAGAAPAGPGASSSRVKHLDATGPVTVLSKTQVATGDTAAYDKAQNKVWLIGNVTLSDGGNVTKGDKLTYDLTTGQATVDTGSATSRVRGLFIPGSGSGDGDKAKAQK